MISDLNIQIEDLLSRGAADFEISKVFKTEIKSNNKGTLRSKLLKIFTFENSVLVI